jgi:hypothetical protein
MNEQKIFLSYARADASSFALQLATDLRAAGANVWIDQQNIDGGENYHDAIGNALDTATHVLFIVSEKSIRSKFVLTEVYYALDEEKVVIPVITYEAKLPFRLRSLQQISFVSDYQVSFNKLLRSLRLAKSASVKPSATESENTGIKHITKETTSEISISGAEEDMHWQAVKVDPSISAYSNYLEKHPDGKHAAAAKEQLSQLQTNAEKKQVLAARQAEENRWRQSQESNTLLAYEEYLALYPNGRFADEANGNIAVLEQAQHQPTTVMTEQAAEQASVRQKDATETIPVSQSLTNESEEANVSYEFDPSTETVEPDYSNPWLNKRRIGLFVLAIGVVIVFVVFLTNQSGEVADNTASIKDSLDSIAHSIQNTGYTDTANANPDTSKGTFPQKKNF